MLPGQKWTRQVVTRQCVTRQNVAEPVFSVRINMSNFLRFCWVAAKKHILNKMPNIPNDILFLGANDQALICFCKKYQLL